ncbi:hypothetical protein [Pseudomonas sp.]|uniref:hypothetical protein n=1 Tax=Pseudomonas sp. TaxID=306 RepID=UPI0028B175D1|nr:hypothetical protein [Pseudomonas sp.]
MRDDDDLHEPEHDHLLDHEFLHDGIDLEPDAQGALDDVENEEASLDDFDDEESDHPAWHDDPND